ncbi:MAG: AAA family ATPase, partial [archaeon]
MASQQTSQQKSQETRVIGIISGKGGVGKTTLVSNLGAVLAEEFKKDVVVLDCNFTTSHLGLYLGLYQTPITLNTVLQGKAELEDAIYTHRSGMKVIP